MDFAARSNARIFSAFADTATNRYCEKVTSLAVAAIAYGGVRANATEFLEGEAP